MSNISSAYINAILADAAYIDLPRGKIDPDADIYKVLSKRMTSPLAKFIADNFEVISNRLSNDFIGTGFDAIVWKGRKGTPYEGKVFLSTRGTEIVGMDFWGADIDLALSSSARSQIIDMVNWWLRETTPATETTMQLENIDIPFPIRKPVSLPLPISFVKAGSPAQGTGRLVGVNSISINGHSLGGHLASAFARVLGGSLSIEHISTFNSAGFLRGTAEFFFNQVDSLLGKGLPMSAVSDKQTNYFAENGINVTTNTWWFAQMGQRVGLFQEEGTGLANHYMYRLTDMLALGHALEKLSPSLDIETFNQIVSYGSHIAKGSLEGVLDAVRRFIQDPHIESLPASDAGDSKKERVKFHEALTQLQDDPVFRAFEGKLRIQPCGAIAPQQACDSFAAFVALHTLSPMYIFSDDSQALNSLWESGHWKKIYQNWQADQAARAAGQPALHYSDNWYSDRCAMLRHVLLRNLHDSESVLKDGAANISYIDRMRFSSTLPPDELHCGSASVGDQYRQRIEFGSIIADEIRGASADDHLYGGDGDDWLKGNSGNDYLEGGAGNDTYVFCSTDTGTDTIYDSDGKGQLEYEGTVLKGGMRLHKNVWFNKSQGFVYSLVGSETCPILLVQRKEGDKTRRIATIRGWRNGDLGLSMMNQPYVDSDLITKDLSNESGLIHVNASASSEKGVFLTGNNQSGSFQGSRFADHIETGDGNSNYVTAAAGDDTVIGGAGREYIRAGAAFLQPGQTDDDTVYGGRDTDMIYGGAGDDWLWGDSDDELWQQSNNNSHQRGDWISGEAGSDHIHGSSASDVLFGGAGEDHIKGGAGDDLILGDAQYSVASRSRAASYSGNSGTRSYVLEAGQSEFRPSRNEDEYNANAVQVPWTGVHEWNWQENRLENNFKFTLAAGMRFLMQQRVAAQGGDDILDGGEGSDWIAGQTGNDILYGGAGNDILYGDDSRAMPEHAASGDDQLYAGAGLDWLYGGAGNDYLDASDDDKQQDLLHGEDGDDTLIGGSGHDELHGGAGDDRLAAGSDGSRLEGGAGNDTFIGGAGNDFFMDESGNDTYHLSAGSDTIFDHGGQDTYHLYSGMLQQGSRTVINDIGGQGRLLFDGMALTQESVKATEPNQWQSRDGKAWLTRQGADLIICASANGQPSAGHILVQGFFRSGGEFLGLQLPPYEAGKSENQSSEPNPAPSAAASIANGTPLNTPLNTCATPMHFVEGAPLHNHKGPWAEADALERAISAFGQESGQGEKQQTPSAPTNCDFMRCTAPDMHFAEGAPLHNHKGPWAEEAQTQTASALPEWMQHLLTQDFSAPAEAQRLAGAMASFAPPPSASTPISAASLDAQLHSLQPLMAASA